MAKVFIFGMGGVILIGLVFLGIVLTGTGAKIVQKMFDKKEEK